MAGGMVLPIVASFYYADGAQYALIFAALLMASVGLFLRNIVGRKASYDLHERESFWITSVVWITVPLCGAIPYLMTGTLQSFTDAAFESISGFTTTGSSVIVRPEAIPESVLLWRSMTQWIAA